MIALDVLQFAGGLRVRDCAIITLTVDGFGSLVAVGADLFTLGFL